MWNLDLYHCITSYCIYHLHNKFIYTFLFLGNLKYLQLLSVKEQMESEKRKTFQIKAKVLDAKDFIEFRDGLTNIHQSIHSQIWEDPRLVVCGCTKGRYYCISSILWSTSQMLPIVRLSFIPIQVTTYIGKTSASNILSNLKLYTLDYGDFHFPVGLLHDGRL